MVLLIHLSVAALLLILGVVFFRGKGASLIAGYNTASAEEKARTDDKKLCRFMGEFMLALAACWLVAALSEVFHNKGLLWTGMVLFLAVTVVGLIYMNTGNRFNKRP